MEKEVRITLERTQNYERLCPKYVHAKQQSS